MISRGRSRADYSSIPRLSSAFAPTACTLHGLSHARRECVDDLAATGQLVRIEEEIDRESRSGRNSAASLSRPAGRRSISPGSKAAGFRWSAICSARSSGCGILFRDTLDSVHRLIEMKIDPTWRMRAAVGGARNACGTARRMLPRHVAPRAGAGRTRRPSANCRNFSLVARRRRSVHHLAAGLHGRPRAARLAAIESWRVSRAAFRRAISAERGSRPALSNPSRHRRASCRGDSARRAAAGEYLRRRRAGDDRGRGDAAARRIVGTWLCRRARRAARADDPPAGRSCRFMPKPIFASPARSIRIAACPRDRSAITWATTAWRTIFPCCGSSECIIGRIAIWPFTVVGRPPQEDTVFGQFIHELTGPIVPTLRAGRAGRACGRCGGRASAAVGDRQRTLHAV